MRQGAYGLLVAWQGDGEAYSLSHAARHIHRQFDLLQWPNICMLVARGCHSVTTSANGLRHAYRSATAAVNPWLHPSARVVIEDYRCQYNHHRPHSKLGYQSPKRFAATTQSAPSAAPVALRAPYAAAGQTKANNITNNQVSD